MDPFLRIIIDITEGFEFVRGCFEILLNILNKIVFRPDSPLMNRSQTVRPQICTLDGASGIKTKAN